MSTTPRERPILFSGPMVRAILEGRKTQTRRVAKPQPPIDAEAVGANSYEGPEGPAWFWWKGNRDERKFWPPTTGGANSIHCPFGQPGDRLWARETWMPKSWSAEGGWGEIEYAADGAARQVEGDWSFSQAYPSSRPVTAWRPSIHMPRWASRITLEITRVRVERVQDITEADAIAEGVTVATLGNAGWLGPDAPEGAGYSYVPRGFAATWDDINGPRGHGWSVNPWVWVIDFERIKP